MSSVDLTRPSRYMLWISTDLDSPEEDRCVEKLQTKKRKMREEDKLKMGSEINSRPQKSDGSDSKWSMTDWQERGCGIQWQ